MKHLAGALVSLAVVVAIYVWLGYAIAGGVAHGAVACPRAYVTGAEWDRVQPGMTRAEVREVLGGDGRLGPSVGVREYRVCGEGRRNVRAIVWYEQHGRIMAGGLWLEVRR